MAGLFEVKETGKSRERGYLPRSCTALNARETLIFIFIFFLMRGNILMGFKAKRT